MSKAFAFAGARLGYLAADPAVVDALRELGEFKAQGHLFGRPVSAADILNQLGELGLLREMDFLPEATPAANNSEPIARPHAASA